MKPLPGCIANFLFFIQQQTKVFDVYFNFKQFSDLFQNLAKAKASKHSRFQYQIQKKKIIYVKKIHLVSSWRKEPKENFLISRK